MIELVNITKTFGNQTVNNNISMQFEKGIHAIVGKSGSGKSTLLHILGGLLKPTSGSVLVDGIDIYGLNDKNLGKFRNDRIGFVFQSFFLENSYTPYENVELPLIISKRKYDKNIINNSLDRFGVLDKANEKVSNLSGGEKQRIAIARAIVMDPDILLCDEPTGNLDEANGLIVFNYLREISKNKLVIIVTHNMELAKQCDYFHELKDGKIV